MYHTQPMYQARNQVRVLSTGGVGGSFPHPSNVSASPQKFFLKKNIKLFQILILFDDDINESVKATNVQKCNFSQS